MNSSFCTHGQGHLKGDNAPHPIGPRWRLLAALLLLALRSLWRCRLASRSQARGLPSSRCPGVRGHTWSRSAQPCQRTPAHPSAPQRSPAHPSAAHSGAFNCGFQDDRRGRGQTRRNSHADADLAGLGPTPRCVRCAAAALRHGRRSLRHTLEQGLGEAFATEVRLAWTQVYGVIADTMQQAGRVSEPA